MFEFIEMYKGFEIDSFSSGFTVCFEGDEIFFDTIEAAKEFIDEVA